MKSRRYLKLRSLCTVSDAYGRSRVRYLLVLLICSNAWAQSLSNDVLTCGQLRAIYAAGTDNFSNAVEGVRSWHAGYARRKTNLQLDGAEMCEIQELSDGKNPTRILFCLYRAPDGSEAQTSFLKLRKKISECIKDGVVRYGDDPRYTVFELKAKNNGNEKFHLSVRRSEKNSRQAEFLAYKVYKK